MITNAIRIFAILIVTLFDFFKIQLFKLKSCLDKRAEEYCKGKPECMDVLRGVVRQSKSFTMPEKGKQNQQTMRSPSLGHEITFSDDNVRSSRTDKFEKIFSGEAAASNMQNYENEEEYEGSEGEEGDHRLKS